jgi:hypothetical protein
MGSIWKVILDAITTQIHGSFHAMLWFGPPEVAKKCHPAGMRKHAIRMAATVYHLSALRRMEASRECAASGPKMRSLASMVRCATSCVASWRITTEKPSSKTICSATSEPKV